MKKYKLVIDTLLLALLLLFSVLTAAPRFIVMPNAVQMVLLVITTAIVGGFLALVWRENPNDEREAQNQYAASRTAYAVGCLVLIGTLVVQGIRHHIDPMIPIILLAMVSAKLIAQLIRDKK